MMNTCDLLVKSSLISNYLQWAWRGSPAARCFARSADECGATADNAFPAQRRHPWPAPAWQCSAIACQQCSLDYRYLKIDKKTYSNYMYAQSCIQRNEIFNPLPCISSNKHILSVCWRGGVHLVQRWWAPSLPCSAYCSAPSSAAHCAESTSCWCGDSS